MRPLLLLVPFLLGCLVTALPVAAQAACTVALSQPPSGSTAVSTPTFRWTGNCSRYRVQFSPSGTFTADLIQTPWQVGKTYGLTEPDWDGHLASDWSSGVWWRVQGKTAAGEITTPPKRRLNVDPDLDNDGISVGSGDCDDTNSTVFPGASEECDGIDTNCDAVVDAPVCSPPWTFTHPLHPQIGGYDDAAVGLYEIALDAPRGVLYFTNLHLPFLGKVDVNTLEYLGSVDLREAFGADHLPPFTSIAVDEAEARLYATDRRLGAIASWDTETGDWLTTAFPCGVPATVQVHGGDVFVACTDDRTLLYLDPETLLETKRISVGPQVEAFAVDEDYLYALQNGSDPGLSRYNRLTGLRSGPPLHFGTLFGRAASLPGVGVFVTDREEGGVYALTGSPLVVTGFTTVGSDPFGILVTGEEVRVVLRQGEEVLPGEAYVGEPSQVVTLSTSLLELDRQDVGRTAHFVVWDEARSQLLVGNEDTLSVSSLPDAGGLATDSGSLGLTLDGLSFGEDRVWAGSHLTDEVWFLDLPSATTTPLTTCAWPFTIAVDEAASMGYAVCQERAEVEVIDLAIGSSLGTLSTEADTFFTPCDPLCTDHFVLPDIALWGDGQLAISDPPGTALHLVDPQTGVDRVVSLGGPPITPPTGVHHFSVGALPSRTTLWAWEPLDGVLYSVDGDSGMVLANVPATSSQSLAVVVEEELDRAWVGNTAWNEDLDPAGTLPAGMEAVTAGAGWLLAEDESLNLHVFQGATLTEVASFEPSTLLAAPPYPVEEGRESPLRFGIGPDGRLYVANTFAGVLDRFTLPELLRE